MDKKQPQRHLKISLMPLSFDQKFLLDTLKRGRPLGHGGEFVVSDNMEL